MTWTIKLARRERLISHKCMGLDPDVIDGAEASAVIIGEAPGLKSSADCPMFPYPPYSSGGRLLSIADIDPTEYLRRFARVDLLEMYPGPMPWTQPQKSQAATRAREILDKADGMTLILLGRQVAQAFGEHGDIELFGSMEFHGLWPVGGVVTVFRLPHPSGRSNGYSGRPERARARELLRKAAQQPLPACPECGAVGTSHELPLVYPCTCGRRLSFRRAQDASVIVETLGEA